MDTPTHGIIGRLAVRALWPGTEGRGLANVATVAGLVPDLDVFIPGDPLARLETHRGLSHSLLGAVVGAAALAWVARKVGLRGVTYPRVYSASMVGWLLHILFDVFTSYGTMVLKPFSNLRLTTDTLFIIDPYLTLMVIVGLLVGWWLRDRRSGTYRLAFAVMVSYVGFNALVTGVSAYRMNDWAEEKGISVDRLAALPVPFSPMYRRGVVVSQDRVFDAPVSLFGRQDELLEEHLSAQGDSRLARLWETRAGRIYRWFARFPVVVSEGEDQPGRTDRPVRVEMQDVRFVMRPEGMGWLGTLAAEAALDHNPDFFKRRIFTLAVDLNESGDPERVLYNGGAIDRSQ